MLLGLELLLLVGLKLGKVLLVGLELGKVLQYGERLWWWDLRLGKVLQGKLQQRQWWWRELLLLSRGLLRCACTRSFPQGSGGQKLHGEFECLPLKVPPQLRVVEASYWYQDRCSLCASELAEAKALSTPRQPVKHNEKQL